DVRAEQRTRAAPALVPGEFRDELGHARETARPVSHAIVKRREAVDAQCELVDRLRHARKERRLPEQAAVRGDAGAELKAMPKCARDFRKGRPEQRLAAEEAHMDRALRVALMPSELLANRQNAHAVRALAIEAQAPIVTAERTAEIAGFGQSPDD